MLSPHLASCAQPKKWQLEIEQEANREAFGPCYDPLVDDPLAEMDEEGCDEVSSPQHSMVTHTHAPNAEPAHASLLTARRDHASARAHLRL